MAGPREWYEELPSTQDRAIELARAGAEEGTFVVARRQRAGRGRADHVWESPVGGLYLSLVVATTDDANAGLLPLAVGAYLAESLATRFGLPLRVKWPNDLLVVSGRGSPRKLAGILVDRVGSPRLGSAAVVGIGLNVAVDRAALAPELQDRAAVLTELVRPGLDPVYFEPIVVGAALDAAGAVRDPGRAGEVRSRCRSWLHGVGMPASLDGRPVGVIVGLAEDGALWVEERGERMAIRAGDLRVEEVP